MKTELEINKMIDRLKNNLDDQMKELCCAPLTGNILQFYVYGGDKGRKELFNLFNYLAPIPFMYAPIYLNPCDMHFLGAKVNKKLDAYIFDFHVIPNSSVTRYNIMVGEINRNYPEGILKRLL